QPSALRGQSHALVSLANGVYMIKACRAGILNETQTLELVAYILQANGYPAGQQALQTKTLKQIQVLKP
ncbi:MAG: hypothetical protein K6T35_09125, partial [Meiothermus silvanus]|nr:hypothetical protein [Allomeiothermus silvanus]